MYNSRIFSKFADLCSQPQDLSLEHFYYLKKKSCAHLQSFSVPIPSFRKLLIYFLSIQICFFEHFIEMESLSMWLLCLPPFT